MPQRDLRVQATLQQLFSYDMFARNCSSFHQTEVSSRLQRTLTGIGYVASLAEPRSEPKFGGDVVPNSGGLGGKAEPEVYDPCPRLVLTAMAADDTSEICELFALSQTRAL